jgi:hypothetical protein
MIARGRTPGSSAIAAAATSKTSVIDHPMR